MKAISTLTLLVVLLGCNASSKTSCENPNANDPVCTLDSDRTVSSTLPGNGADAAGACNSEREGLISFEQSTGRFKLCSGGRNVDIPLEATQGPVGPTGPTGPQGPGGSTANAEFSLTRSSVIAPGASLTLTHGFNSSAPSAFAYFARGGTLRPISSYKNDVGRKTLEITGASWGQNLRPQVLQLSDGRILVIHEVAPEQGVRETVLDLYSDEGEAIQLALRRLPAMSTVRAINVSTGVLLVYELVGGSDELFTVLSNAGVTIVPPTVIGPSPANNRVKDLKRLSNGYVVIAEQFATQAAFHIIDPVQGTLVASNTTVAASSDYRTVTAPVAGKFYLFFTDLSTVPNAQVAVFNNDGSLNTAPSASGLGDETVFGANAIAADRIAVVTSYVSNVSSTLFDGNLTQIRAKSIFSPLSADGASPLSLGNGLWVVCSSRSEGYCITYDREGQELFRNGDLFKSDTSGEFSAMTALGAEGRFALMTRNSTANAGFLNLLQSAPGRLDLEVVDANTVRVVNRSVESLPIVLTVLK
jgi:hypothetical protein